MGTTSATSGVKHAAGFRPETPTVKRQRTSYGEVSPPNTGRISPQLTDLTASNGDGLAAGSFGESSKYPEPSHIDFSKAIKQEFSAPADPEFVKYWTDTPEQEQPSVVVTPSSETDVNDQYEPLDPQTTDRQEGLEILAALGITDDLLGIDEHAAEELPDANREGVKNLDSLPSLIRDFESTFESITDAKVKNLLTLKKWEKKHPAEDTLIEGGLKDHHIVTGRGGAKKNHIGNERFRTLASKKSGDYKDAKKRNNKKDIIRITAKTLLAFEKLGFKFVNQDEDTKRVSETSTIKAYNKTSQLFRDLNPPANKTQST